MNEAPSEGGALGRGRVSRILPRPVMTGVSGCPKQFVAGIASHLRGVDLPELVIPLPFHTEFSPVAWIDHRAVDLYPGMSVSDARDISLAGHFPVNESGISIDPEGHEEASCGEVTIPFYLQGITPCRSSAICSGVSSAGLPCRSHVAGLRPNPSCTERLALGISIPCPRKIRSAS